MKHETKKSTPQEEKTMTTKEKAPRTQSTKKEPDAIDVAVGAKIRLMRHTKGMSQTKLAEHLGVTFQQVQKYEKGTNRVGGSRMQHIANALGTNVGFFFEDAPRTTGDAASNGANAIMEFMSTSEGLQLNKAFVRIEDPRVRRRIIDLAIALAPAKDQ